MTTGKRGGRRPGAGRPRLPDQERGRTVSLYLTPGEKAAVKSFLEELRKDSGSLATVRDIVARSLPTGSNDLAAESEKAAAAPEPQGGGVLPDASTVRAYPSGATTEQYALDMQQDTGNKKGVAKRSGPRPRTFNPIYQMDEGQQPPAADELPPDWPGIVTVWKGARVEFCAADTMKGGRRWVKGQTATVQGFKKAIRMTRPVDIRLLLDTGEKMVLSPKGWVIRRKNKVVGNIWQFPIKLLPGQDD